MPAEGRLESQRGTAARYPIFWIRGNILKRLQLSMPHKPVPVQEMQAFEGQCPASTDVASLRPFAPQPS